MSDKKTVVKNDTSANAEIEVFDNTVNQLHALTSERKNWENTLLRKSNQALYAILAKCYETYEVMSQRDKAGILARKALKQVCVQNNYLFMESTPLVTKVVKCVFGVDRRRVSAYSIVIREAIKQEIKPENLAEWVEEMGGVEQVRLSKSPNAKTAKQKAELGQQALQKSDEIAKVKSKKLSQATNPENVGEQVVLLAVQNADGSFSINGVVESAGATTAALAAYHQQTKKAQDQKAEEQKSEEKQKGLDEAISNAAQEAQIAA